MAVTGLTTLSIPDRGVRSREYHRWLEDKVLGSIKEYDNELFTRIVSWHRQWIALVASSSEEARSRG